MLTSDLQYFIKIITYNCFNYYAQQIVYISSHLLNSPCVICAIKYIALNCSLLALSNLQPTCTLPDFMVFQLVILTVHGISWWAPSSVTSVTHCRLFSRGTMILSLTAVITGTEKNIEVQQSIHRLTCSVSNPNDGTSALINPFNNIHNIISGSVFTWPAAQVSEVQDK